jgi:hypothetical protein
VQTKTDFDDEVQEDHVKFIDDPARCLKKKLMSDVPAMLKICAAKPQFVVIAARLMITWNCL